MAITDLLSSVSKPRSASPRSAFSTPAAGRRAGPAEPRAAGGRRRGLPPAGTVDALAAAAGAAASMQTPDRPPLPSYAVLLIGGLTLTCLALAAALVMALSGPAAPDASDLAVPVAAVSAASPDAPAAVPATAFDAQPAAIPTSLLTRLEAASDGPLEQEFALLLEGIQIGFGDASVQLEPTLRSYAYRMASRFVWNPDTFRVDVRAPDEALASARAATLVRLFEAAVDEGRLDVRPSVGPHSLSLASR